MINCNDERKATLDPAACFIPSELGSEEIRAPGVTIHPCLLVMVMFMMSYELVRFLLRVGKKKEEVWREWRVE